MSESATDPDLDAFITRSICYKLMSVTKGKKQMNIHSTAKQEAIEMIKHLPDTVDFDDILYRLYVAKKIHQGLQEADEGKGISTEEMLQEIEQW